MRIDATAVCATRLARVAGTHALLLGAHTGAPALPGVANWTVLQPAPHGTGWRGPLHADTSPLPFGDDSFCAVLVCFTGAEVAPESIAGELSRVLAPHGVLLVTDMHPRSLWHSDSVSPGRWERALRAADLKVAPAMRCGAPWPRAQGVEGMPHWLVRGLGGAYVIEARRRTLAAIPLRKTTAKRHAVEHNLLPGARRQCA